MHDFCLGNTCQQAYILVKDYLLLVTKNKYLELMMSVLFYA